jgi:hypothetical protein
MLSFRTLDLVPLLTLAASALGSGERLRRSRHTEYRTDLSFARVTGHGSFPYQVDGDYLGETTELRFRHEPDIMDLVVP